MIEVNLLPDVKQQLIKAKRTQRLVIFAALIIAGSALAVFLLLFITVKVWQKQRIADLDSDITKYSNQLKATENLDRILTVQQQLISLPQLHAEKPAVKRLFGYLSQVTPATLSISAVDVDIEARSLSITGSAPSLLDINKFVDTLKFTKYKLTPDSPESPAFSDIVLANFGSGAKGTASYGVTLKFDSIIFDSSTTQLSLVVPKNFITTRSETERPKALFDNAEGAQ